MGLDGLIFPVSLHPAEKKGDGHKADEDVCIRGAERSKAGASATYST